MKNRKSPALHDFYLKMFQFTKVYLPYDVILVDEAQDTSGVMLSIIKRQEHARRIFVGDSYQQIYAFRHAVNSLDRVEGKASGSARLSVWDGLARQMSQRVNQGYELLGETPKFKNEGMDMDTRFGKRAYKGKYPLAVIARSNLSLFDAVLGHLFGKGAKAMHFEGGYPGYSFMNARVAGFFTSKRRSGTKSTIPSQKIQIFRRREALRQRYSKP